MKYASFCQRIQGEGAAAWNIHMQAQKAADDGADVVVMSVGDPDMPTATGIMDAAARAMRAGDTHYVDVMGKESLRQAIALRHQERSGQTVTAADVMVFSGAQNALFASLFCLVEAGDAVIVLEPAYVTYEASIRATGADLIRVPQLADDGFRPNLQAIAAAITEHTRVILLASPNNPTGVVLNRQELAFIADLAKQHDLWIITDDVYCELVYDGDYVSMASVDGIHERLVILGSLSKSHAMTGWRTGWAIAPQPLIEHFYNVSLTMLYGLPGFVQEGALWALTEAWPERKTMAEVYRRRRDLVVSMLQPMPRVVPLVPAAGMFMLVDIRQTGLTSQTFVQQLYEQQGVSVLSAAAFGACGEGFVRISFTLADDRLQAGLTRMANFLQQLP